MEAHQEKKRSTPRKLRVTTGFSDAKTNANEHCIHA
jgi:hypothetical protein